jgi:hypothetical protein
MRIWVDPAKLQSYQLTPQDVINAVQSENVQVSSGSLGGLPTRKQVQLNATVLGSSRMKTAEQFNEILVKVNPDGSQVRWQRCRDGWAWRRELFDFRYLQRQTRSGHCAASLATGANRLTQ